MHTSSNQRTTIKRTRSPSSDIENRNKKIAREMKDFVYDKETHVYENNDLKFEKYFNDRLDNIYKVNVKKIDNTAINRIVVGKLLTKFNVNNISNCKKVSWNSICVQFTRKDDANKLVSRNNDLRNFGYVASIPVYYRSVVGVLNNVPVDLSAKELFDEISLDNDILKIERMTRKMRNGQRDYSLNIRVTFNNTELPSSVNIYHGLERVKPYIPPVLQCIGCLKFGHHVNACKARNNFKCSKCGSIEHDRNTCTAARLSCVNCNGEHEATSRECLEKKRQNNIRILMSGRNMSYREVIENFPTYTSKNQFNLLENLDEFPTLQRVSFRNQLKGRTSYIKSSVQKRLINVKSRPDTFSKYFTDLVCNTEPTAPIKENTNRVSEVEKTKSLIDNLERNDELNNVTKFANNDSINELEMSVYSNAVSDDGMLESEDKQNNQHSIIKS